MKRPPGLTESEWATYQSLRDRGFSHNIALNDALDGVDVRDLRDSKIHNTREDEA